MQSYAPYAPYKKLRNVVFLLGLASSVSLNAAETSSGLVPMDLVREFAGGTVSAGLPAGFPPLNLPADLDLRLVGSVEQNSYTQRVILKTPLSREVLNERLLASLTVQGWTDVAGVFPAYSLRLCHDTYGSMSVNTSPSGAENKVEVSRSFHPLQLRDSCAAQREASRLGASWYSYFTSQFPVLEVPEGAVNGSPRPSIFSGSSASYSAGNVEIARDSTIEVPDTTIAAVYDGFAAQMQQQGWQADSSSKGERSATSVWFKTVAAPALSTENVTMVATLTLTRGTGDAYGILLKLQSLPAPGDGARGISSGFFF